MNGLSMPNLTQNSLPFQSNYLNLDRLHQFPKTQNQINILSLTSAVDHHLIIIIIIDRKKIDSKNELPDRFDQTEY